MNPYLQKLYYLGLAPKRRILGLMSGTSLDGLDLAYVHFWGSGPSTKMELIHFHTIPYKKELREKILEIFSKSQVDMEKICLMNEYLGQEFSKMVLNQLKEWNLEAIEVDMIASHGQTIIHSPQSTHQEKGFPNGTLQIGDGDHIAQGTGIITLSDFRQKNLAAGGEGAPLVPYGESLLFRDSVHPRILINIGGISNFTFLPPKSDPRKIFSSDLGPGNTLMDGIVREYFPPNTYDPEGSLARNGRVHSTILKTLMEDPFFFQTFPKTTGPELFNKTWLVKKLQGLDPIDPKDLLATLNELTAESILMGIQPYLDVRTEVFVSGGGHYNEVLMEKLRKGINPLKLENTNRLGIHPDAKEAVLFALLANESIAGTSQEYGMDPIKFPPVSMGKISFPG